MLGLSIVTGTAFSQRIYGTGGLPGFIVGMFLVGAGTGIVKPNITVFLSRHWETTASNTITCWPPTVDQLPEEEPKVVSLKDGKSAVMSRELTIRFIWNVNYWYVWPKSLPRGRVSEWWLNRMINVGGLCGVITTNVEKHAGFGFAFLICLCLIALSVTIFQAGYLKFRKQTIAF